MNSVHLQVQTRVKGNKRGGGTQTCQTKASESSTRRTISKRIFDVKERRRRRRQYRECNDKQQHRCYTERGMSERIASRIAHRREIPKTSGNHSRRIKNLHEQDVFMPYTNVICYESQQTPYTTARMVREIRITLCTKHKYNIAIKLRETKVRGNHVSTTKTLNISNGGA